jgi:hypothetical protein
MEGNPLSELELPKQLIELGDKPGAIKELTRILQASPGDIDAWFLMVDAVDDPAKKVDCYKQILKIDPDNQFAQIHYQKLATRPFVSEVQEQDQPKTQLTREIYEPPKTAPKKPATPPVETGLFGLDYQTTIQAGIVVFVVLVLLLFVVVLAGSGVLNPPAIPTPTRIMLPPTWTPHP